MSLENIGTVYNEQGKHDEAVEKYEEALAVYTRALGVDNHANPNVYFGMVKAKLLSGDKAGAVESARECVRIFDKLDITNKYSQYAVDMVMRLEGIE